MSLKEQDKPLITFYQQDVVQKITAPNSYGIVLRCWHDAEDMPIPNPLQDPLMRPLKRGEVGVSFLSESGKREILPESDLKLLDRTLQPGDFCKRNVDDIQSGVILNVRVNAHLEHVISGEQAEGWKTSEDLEFRKNAEIGDYVVYNDWVGQVIELYDENIVETPTGHLVRLPEFSSRLSIGEKSEGILPTPIGGVQNVLDFLFGSNRPGLETVIAVKHTVYAIAWLALNQTLDTQEAEQRERPQRFWHGPDISKLTLIRNRTDFQMRISDRVMLKDATGVPFTQHGREEEPGGVIFVRSFTVNATETTLDILWQDGSRETVKSVDVIPYLNPDEYDCWPGDHVFWSSEGVKRAAVVQSVNATDRTASVLFSDSGRIDLVSVLELDPHGTSDAEVYAGTEGLGVRRGDTVFVHGEGATNGFDIPRVPRIGEIEAWVRESPFVGQHPGQLGGWRKEMADLGSNIASQRAIEGTEEGTMRAPPKNGTMLWIGEVIDLRLDGNVEVLHPDGTARVYPLRRLTKLYDGIEQLEDELYEGSHWGSEPEEGQEIWPMHEDGIWWPGTDPLDEPDAYIDGFEGDFEDIQEDGEEMSAEGDTMDVDDFPGTLPLSLPHMTDTENHSGMSPRPETPIESVSGLSGRASDDIPNIEDDEDGVDIDNGAPWKRFDILPSAPVDHAYYSTTPLQHSKAFVSRLAREYRILMSSLPDSIIVRAFEDRADLLRCLIIGPQNTPYEDAPFVIDWMLDSNFPQSPPLAHFLSWTNGNGRVNPNLYEEGKVCLSILGTWAGDRNETWSPSRSSLLQALVSIQGLVLVKEPWFCEPAYEKLRGTEEGIVNSRLYSEKAYVLSRGFVRRALEIPLGGLELEISGIYYSNHRLKKVLDDARALIEKSRVTSTQGIQDDGELAVPRLTAGGIIALERTLSKLQGLLDSHSLVVP